MEVGQHYLQFGVLVFEFSGLALQLRVFAFQFGGLALQLFVELFHQIEPDGLQGIVAEDLQGGGHLRQLVVPFHYHLFFQIALGHLAHTAGKHIDAVQNHPAHEQPTDQQCAADADDADGQQQGEAGGDGP